MAIDGALPLWAENDGVAYANAREYRRLLRALTWGSDGIVDPGDYAVAQNGTPNMSVNVSRGGVVVLGTESAPNQGGYFVHNDATVNVGIAASDPTNPRYDLIVVRVRDKEYSGATYSATIEVKQGTAAASPVEPTPDANSYVLARVSVAAAATSITNANITDRRAYLLGWQVYVPEFYWGGSQWVALNNGTRWGAYRRRGGTVDFRAGFNYGSTSSAGTGVLAVQLPVTGKSNANTDAVAGSASILDASANRYNRVLRYGSAFDRVYLVDMSDAGISHNSPFTWANNDSVAVAGTFEAATV